MPLIQLIKERLNVLSPSELNLIDNSLAHKGHAGNSGGGHFNLTIISSHFSKKTMIMRHRMVYELLNDLIPQRIHAISILAISPDDPNMHLATFSNVINKDSHEH
jgi:BolA family transcriptional regulator, general stress-responsive regulator